MDLWDIRQQGQIHAAQAGVDQANSKARNAERKTESLQQQIDHLTLLCQSMWELLRDHSDLADDLLLAKVADIDTRDGKADGKIGKQVLPCPSCGANCNTASQHCTMCGEDLKRHKPHIFEA